MCFGTLLNRLHPEAVAHQDYGSVEREAILKAVRAGHHTPTAVAEFLHKDVGAVSMNMVRMLQRGMLVRPARGYYEVPAVRDEAAE